MANRKLSGSLRIATGEAPKGTSVRLSGPEGAPKLTKTEENGTFEFDLDSTYKAGTYRVEALATPEALEASREVELADSVQPDPVELTAASRPGNFQAFLGWAFLAALIAGLAILANYYLDLHQVELSGIAQQDAAVGKKKKISDDLSRMLEVASSQLAGVVEVGDAAGGQDQAARKAGLEAALSASMVADSLEAAEDIFADVKKRRLAALPTDKTLAVDNLFGQAGKALEAGDAAALAKTIENLEGAILEAAEPLFWTRKPWILAEAYFWALAATLVRIIFSTGNYLYRRTFLAFAIPHHLAIVVALPPLAVLISFVLSLVEVSVSLSEVDLVLDMSNVYIVIVVASLIGFAPWKAWDFFHDLADRLFKWLGRLFSSD